MFPCLSFQWSLIIAVLKDRVRNEEKAVTGDEMQRAIQFLVERQAKLSAGIKELKERIAARLDLSESVSRPKGQGEVGRSKMQEPLLNDKLRESFNKLMLSNEVTRELTSQVARILQFNHPTRDGS